MTTKIPHMFTGHEDVAEEDYIESLAQEGDEDAVFVADFETAATEVVQSDEDLAAAFSTYMEARRKLSEKVSSQEILANLQQGEIQGLQGQVQREKSLDQPGKLCSSAS